MEGDKLRLDQPKKTVLLGRLKEVPADLDISPLPLPEPGPVPPEMVKEIAAELSARAVKDQEALKLPDAEVKRPVLLEENRLYLRSVVERYGWIDIPRFGRHAAAARYAAPRFT